MKYVIDIDGTICQSELDNSGKIDYNMSIPHKERIRFVNELYDNGHEIVYWTARGSASGKDYSELTKRQMTEWGAKYHKLEFRKPSYDIWVDDKAINSEVFFSSK